jgi:hypothetical protein
MKNLTHDQLIELAPKDRPFQIEVENGNIMWAYITSSYNLWTINDSYGYNFWQTEYKGTFTLIDEYRNIYEKPEALKVGQKVRIYVHYKWYGEDKEFYGELGKINQVWDTASGISYTVELKDTSELFPHYCVQPVEEEEEKEDNDLTVKLLINDLEELLRDIDKNNYNFLQEIINKYKK